MPVATAAPAASVTGNKAVVSGGVVLGSGATTTIQTLDLDTLKWSLPLSLNTARYQHGQITLQDGRILIVGGRTRLPAAQPNPTASCELISADLTQCQPTADLPQPSQSPTLHLLDDGRVVAVTVLLVCIYDPATETWQPLCPLHQPRRGQDSIMLRDGTLLIAGGIGRTTFERVDLKAGESTLLDVRLPLSLDDLAVAQLPDGRIWIIGGQSVDGHTTDKTWLLTLNDEAGHKIEDGPALGLPEGVADHLLFKINDGYLLVGGESENHMHDTELAEALWLDPVALTVTVLPSTEIAHDDAAGFVYNNAAYVLGGQVKTPFLGVPRPHPDPGSPSDGLQRVAGCGV